MQDNLIEIVNRTYEYPTNECIILANNYYECICLFRSKEQKKECDKYLDNFLRCKISQKELLLKLSER